MSGDYGTCSECGTPLQLGERRMCSPCWTAYWNAQLESVPVERLMSPEQAHLEQVGNELVLIVANLQQQLALAEQSLTERDQTIRLQQEHIDALSEDLAERDQTIRLQQEHIDALSEDLAEQSRYLGVVCDMLNQEQQLTDGLIQRNNELAAELMDARKRSGHLVR